MKESEHLDVIFKLGYELGELLFKLEQAMISEDKDDRIYRRKIKIKYDLILEKQQDLLLGLRRIGVSEETQTDIESYIDQITMEYGYIPSEEETGVEKKQLIGKVKSKIRVKRKLGTELNVKDLDDLTMKLKLWKFQILETLTL